MSTKFVFVLGEVRTSLIPFALPLTREEVDELLTLVLGRTVLWRHRPVSRATSSLSAVGVACDLPTRSGDEFSVVGTVAVNAVVVGGRLIQSSAATRVVNGDERRRQPWSHYLSRIGVAEVVAKNSDKDPVALINDLSSGYLLNRLADANTMLDLSSVTDRTMNMLRVRRDLLAQRNRTEENKAIRTTTRDTRLRWIATVGGRAAPGVRMEVDDDLRTLHVIAAKEDDLAAIQRFCEDVAVHEWLLTLARDVMADSDRAFATGAPQSEILSPILVHLAQLWMPGAHMPDTSRVFWTGLQKYPGFSKQWTALVQQMRDRVAMATLEKLEGRKPR